jgi:hypothetical protein
MADPIETARAIADAIRAVSPELREVATPEPRWFQGPVRSPDLFPNDVPERGYYVPVPPPPPFRVGGRRLPVLVGEAGGRQWSVQILISGRGGIRAVPTLSVHTFARLVPTDAVPFPVFPWAVATARPEAAKVLLGAAPINLAGRSARSGIGEAAMLSGRLPVPVPRPPIRSPMILESSDPAIGRFLDSPAFLARYLGWYDRAGTPVDRDGSSFPVVRAMGDEVTLTTGIDPTRPPVDHAATVQEFLALVPEMERAVTGRDPLADPIPTVTFTDPPGSVPDLRPGYPCPKCGQLEILKRTTDRPTGLRHERTLRCGVDIFPPYPYRIQDAHRAADAVARP